MCVRKTYPFLRYASVCSNIFTSSFSCQLFMRYDWWGPYQRSISLKTFYPSLQQRRTRARIKWGNVPESDRASRRRRNIFPTFRRVSAVSSLLRTSRLDDLGDLDGLVAGRPQVVESIAGARGQGHAGKRFDILMRNSVVSTIF
jgi:hypothetical protein